MFEDPVCVYKDPEWEISEISTHESRGLVRVSTPGGVAVYAKKHFPPLVKHELMGSPEIHRAFHDFKTEGNMFELQDEEFKWDISTQKPHVEIKQEQMGSTELQSVLRALENELNMAEASIESEHKVTPIDTTVSPVLEHSQKQAGEIVIDNFDKLQDLSNNSTPYKVLGDDQHIGKKRYCCHICKRQFYKKCRLIVHVQVHSRKKNHCIICNISFSSQLNLRKHLCRLHTYAELKERMPQVRVVNYMCKFCKQQYFHESLSTKISLNPKKPYLCFGCHKLFNTKVRSAKYPCEECPERFEDAIDLVVHRRTHAGAPKSYSRVRS